MIRGTNKRIIEINGDDGSCFERVVLFLKPEQDPGDEEKMLKMAEDYAGGFLRGGASPMLLSPPRSARKKLPKALLVACGILAACGLLALCIAFL